MKKVLEQFENTVDEVLKLKDVQESLLKEPISTGKWSIREIIGHLYYWDKYNLEKMIPFMKHGANLPAFPNHDQHNEEAITYLTDYSAKAIINAFVETRNELIESISNVDENVRFTIGNGKRQFSVESFSRIFSEHDIHHLKQIREKLNDRTS